MEEFRPYAEGQTLRPFQNGFPSGWHFEYLEIDSLLNITLNLYIILFTIQVLACQYIRVHCPTGHPLHWRELHSPGCSSSSIHSLHWMMRSWGDTMKQSRRDERMSRSRFGGCHYRPWWWLSSPWGGNQAACIAQEMFWTMEREGALYRILYCIFLGYYHSTTNSVTK